jgi:hypothetical protein
MSCDFESIHLRIAATVTVNPQQLRRNHSEADMC